MPTPIPQDPPTPTRPHSPFHVIPAQTNPHGPYDMWAIEHNGTTLARWNRLDQAHQDADDRYHRWLAEGQPDPTPPHPSVTELIYSLDAARQAFENATPTGTLRDQIEGYAARLHLTEQDLERKIRDKAGLSHGETDRLRKVEAALIELGAPNHSTRQDPAGPMITWIRAQVAALADVKTERDELRTMLTQATAELDDAWKTLDGWEQLADHQAGNTVVQANEKLRAELDETKAALTALTAVKPNTVVLPNDWSNQLYDITDRGTYDKVVNMVQSWQPATTPAVEELPPNDTVYQATGYVTELVLAARGSWPGWAYPDEVPAAVDEALREIKRLRGLGTRALRSGSDALANAAIRMEDHRRELVALLRDHPGGGLIHEPENWAATLGVVRMHLVHRKFDREYRTNLIQAVSRWLTAGEPVADWQMVNLVGQLSDQVGTWFDAATEKPAAPTAPDRPVTFIDRETGRKETYTLKQVVDAMKHSDKGPRELCGCEDCVLPDSYARKQRWLVPKRCSAGLAAVQPVGWMVAPAGWLAGRGMGS